MRALVQRVTRAQVDVGGVSVGAIDRGFVAFVCAMAGDTDKDEAWLLEKILALRVFADAAGKMNLALEDLHAAGTPVGLLAVSQFTLSADLAPGRSKGNRPAFTAAMAPAPAEAAFARFVSGARVRAPWLTVAAGVFGADMQVALVNDGPVTLWLDSSPLASPSPRSSP